MSAKVQASTHQNLAENRSTDVDARRWTLPRGWAFRFRFRMPSRDVSDDVVDVDDVEQPSMSRRVAKD